MRTSSPTSAQFSRITFASFAKLMAAALTTICLALLVLMTSSSNAQVRGQSELRECNILMPHGAIAGSYVVSTWPFGIVPYAFDANVNAENQQRALDAMADIETVSGVSFVPLLSEDNYILITSGSGNSSYVGMIGGEQAVTIFNWTFEFIIVHEFIHALGSWHEHQRTDRDQFVQINWENIEPGAENNFVIEQPVTLTGIYDFDSVMHYAQFDFSANGFPTITVLPPNKGWQELIGQLEYLSEGDIDGLMDMYGMPGPQPMDAISRAFTVTHTDPNFQVAISRSFTVVHTLLVPQEAISRAFTVSIVLCPADLDGSGDVGVKDLLFLLGAWGPCPKKGDCLADFDTSGDVGVKDLLFLLGAWGPCP